MINKQTGIPPNILYIDRSGIETDWSCGMKYWWNRCEGERGITPKIQPSYFQDGTDLHEDLRKVAEGVAWQDVIASIPEPEDQIAIESWLRRRGWVMVFGKWVWPLWSKSYTPVSIEKEIILDRSPLWVGVIPDLVLRCTRKDWPDQYGKLVYKEWKTTGDTSPGWMSSWPYAIQVHLGLAAIKEETGEDIHCGWIVGLPKGYTKDGRLNHPFTWAYQSGEQWSSKYKSGWDHALLSTYPPGLEKWIDQLGQEECAKQFLHSAPIFLNPRLVDSLIFRRIARQNEIAAVTEECRTSFPLRTLYFEQRFKECKPARGSQCPYLEACFNKTVQDNPLLSGLYEPRTPHHAIETFGAEEEG